MFEKECGLCMCWIWNLEAEFSEFASFFKFSPSCHSIFSQSTRTGIVVNLISCMLFLPCFRGKYLLMDCLLSSRFAANVAHVCGFPVMLVLLKTFGDFLFIACLSFAICKDGKHILMECLSNELVTVSFVDALLKTFGQLVLLTQFFPLAAWWVKKPSDQVPSFMQNCGPPFSIFGAASTLLVNLIYYMSSLLSWKKSFGSSFSSFFLLCWSFAKKFDKHPCSYHVFSNCWLHTWQGFESLLPGKLFHLPHSLLLLGNLQVGSLCGQSHLCQFFHADM